MKHPSAPRAKSRRRTLARSLCLCLAALALLLACDQAASPLPPDSKDSRLASLSPSAGSLVPAFDAAVTDYALEVENEVTSITLTGTMADSGASLAGANGQAIALPVGATVLTITVTAEDGVSTTIYTVTVTRAVPDIHLLSFDKNAADASGSMEGQSIAEGATESLEAKGYSRTGYSFAGWAESPSGPLAYADGAEYTMGTSAVTLYALWTANSYSVSFDANGGSGSMAAQPFSFGSVGYLPVCTMTRYGHSFMGWATSPGGASVYENGGPISIGTADLALYALWSPTEYWISFNSALGSGSMDVQEVPFGSTVKLSPNAFAFANHHFLGWSTVSNGSTVAYVDKASITMDAKDLTLFAVWEIDSHTLSFDPNGGTGSMSPQSIVYGQAANLRTCDFAKYGYDFAGWAGTRTGAREYEDRGIYIMGSSDQTLYALWTPHISTVSFHADDGTGEIETQPFSFGTSAPLRALSLVRTGCSFAGWATSSGGSVVYLDQASYTPGTSDLALYPVWKASGSISLSLDAPGGEDLSFAGTFTVAKGATLSVSLTNTGLDNFRWYLDGAVLSGKYSPNLSLASSGLAPGPHYLMVTASDAKGLQYSAGLTVKITN